MRGLAMHAGCDPANCNVQGAACPRDWVPLQCEYISQPCCLCRALEEELQGAKTAPIDVKQSLYKAYMDETPVQVTAAPSLGQCLDQYLYEVAGTADREEIVLETSSSSWEEMLESMHSAQNVSLQAIWSGGQHA